MLHDLKAADDVELAKRAKRLNGVAGLMELEVVTELAIALGRLRRRIWFWA